MFKTVLFAISCLFFPTSKSKNKRCHCMIEKDHLRNKRDGYCNAPSYPTTTRFDKVLFKIFSRKYYWAVAPNYHFKFAVGKYGLYVNHHGKTFGLYFSNVPF